MRRQTLGIAGPPNNHAPLLQLVNNCRLTCFSYHLWLVINIKMPHFLFTSFCVYRPSILTCVGDYCTYCSGRAHFWRHSIPCAAQIRLEQIAANNEHLSTGPTRRYFLKINLYLFLMNYKPMSVHRI